MEHNRENLLGVLRTLYRWRKTIRNICLITAVGSIIISLLLPNFYKSTTIFYPASPQLANPELIFGFTSNVTEYFGSDHDLDRLLEISVSNEVVDYMVQKFDLYTHYDIDSTKNDGPFKVRKKFRKLYSVQKNKNDAIEISIEDKDPVLAAEMINAVRAKINLLGQRLTKDSQSKLLAAFDDNLARKRIEIVRLDDSIQLLQRRYGVFDAGSQQKQLSEALSTAETEISKSKGKLEILANNPLIPQDTIEYIKANQRANEILRRGLTQREPTDDRLTLPRLNEVMPKLSVLQDLHFQARKQFTYDLERYNQIKAAYNTDIPALHVVEKGEVPLRKERPVRSVIVIASVLAAFFFSLIGALLADAYKEVNWDSITRAD